jgi:prolyl-tRNA editing enzyme YbaK/EbsC (Cys-tRNA(Pro) deacylase)
MPNSPGNHGAGNSKSKMKYHFGGNFMGIEKVRQYFSKWNMENRIQEFDVSSATVELAAKALNCEPERIAKTLAFKVNEEPILIVTAGDVKIDNKKYKKRFAAKAKMLSPDEVVDLIGYEVGGVCPFGVNKEVAVYLDESLKRFETVFPACGSSNSAIELSIPELEQYSGCIEWIDVCKIV